LTGLTGELPLLTSTKRYDTGRIDPGDELLERAFRGAIDVTSRQGAWVFALRAAVGLVRLDPGAAETLAAIAPRFPPELESPDLDHARVQLERRP